MKPDDISRIGKNQCNVPFPSVAWDNAYARQGRLWGGAPFPLPELPDRCRVLELGCGSGKLLSLLTGKGYDCVAIDFSPHACRLAQSFIRDPAAAILIADARALPLRSGSFDAVVAHHVIGHLLNTDRHVLVDEAVRVLHDGGKFLFCDFSVGDFRAGMGREVEERTFRRGTGIITHYFTEDEVRSLSDRLTPGPVTNRRYSMKIRGKNYPRCDIAAVMTKR